MGERDFVWLASYPRSGNTLLRTILWQCFGLRSGSGYPDDIMGNQKLAEYIGHVEKEPGNRWRFPEGSIPMIKTHELEDVSNPTIYVIRDGRAAIASLWNFYRGHGDIPMEKLIEGQYRFGTWSDHVQAWNPWERPNTLLLRYEDMTGDLPVVLRKISEYLGRDVLKDSIPDRNSIAAVDGRYTRKKSDWRSQLSDSQLNRFIEINGDTLRRAGYLD